MLYQIIRVSGRGEKPCPQSKPGIWEKEQAFSVEKANATATWMYTGRDHRVENGVAYRTFQMDIWVIEIKSLDELNALVEKLEQEGGCQGVIISCHEGSPKFRLEIYDASRE